MVTTMAFLWGNAGEKVLGGELKINKKTPK